MSRSELADAVNRALDELYPGRDLRAFYVDFRWVGKLERGEHRWPTEHRRAALRRVFGAPSDIALGLYSPRRTDELPAGSPQRAGQTTAGADVETADEQGLGSVSGIDLAPLRASLDAFDVPPDGLVRPIASLRTAVACAVRMRLTSNYQQLASNIPSLLDELHRARLTWSGERRDVAVSLLTQAYRAADALADKFGHYDLSARIITVMTDTARQTGDAAIIATAQYVRGELFFQNGRPELGRALLERAATVVSSDASPTGWAASGSLHMRAAVLAGLAGQPSQARDHLREATEYARRLPDGEYHGTAFGPSSVRIHEVTLAVDTGDPDAALRAAEGWTPPSTVPGERLSHFYIDLARAHAQTGSTTRAVAALFRARTAAPEHTRIHPQVHQVVAALLPRVATSDHLHEYAQWAKAPVG